MDFKSKVLRSKGLEDTYDIEEVFPIIKKWDEKKLPTYKEVIGLVREKIDKGYPYDEAITGVSLCLHKHWIKCNIYPITYVSTKARLTKVINEFRTITRTHESKRGKLWRAKYHDLKNKATKLFDIFNENPKKRKKLEKIWHFHDPRGLSVSRVNKNRSQSSM